MSLPIEAVNASQHLFWITSRAAGTAAVMLAGASVAIGVIMGGRMRKGKGFERRVLHEALSLAAIVALLIHAVSLLGDQYMHPSIADISVPFASSFETGWTSLGIVSGWAMIVLGLSYYVRSSIGIQRWRVLHRFTAVAWIGGVIHMLGEGTDVSQPWYLLLVGISIVPALAALAIRVLSSDSYNRLSADTQRSSGAPRSSVR